MSKKSRNILKLHASKKRPDRKRVAEAVRAAIGNPGTSADPLHPFIHSLRKRRRLSPDAIPKWPPCRQPFAFIDSVFQVLGEVRLQQLRFVRPLLLLRPIRVDS